MERNYKIAISTKGRYGSQVNPKTGKINYKAKLIGNIYQHALDNDIHELDICYLFVEPQDADEYVKTYPKWPTDNIIVIGGNDQGISFVRQTALNFFQNTIPTETVFTLDDDIQIGRYKVLYNAKKDKECWSIDYYTNILGLLDEYLEFMNRLPEQEKVGMGAFYYGQFVFGEVGKWPVDGVFTDEMLVKEGIAYSNHGYCDCAVMLKPLLYKQLGICYDSKAPLKEDRDICAQVAFHGYHTRKPKMFVMDSPLNGTNSAGCSTWYKKEGYCMASCKYLMEKWNKFRPKDDQNYIKWKEKDTSYDRTFDVRFMWKRLFYDRERNRIKPHEEIVTEYNYPEIINNATPYSNWTKIDGN